MKERSRLTPRVHVTVIRAITSSLCAALIALMCATPTLAAEAQGCSGSAESRDAVGKTISTAAAPGVGGTADNPLVLDPAGTVDWKGSTASPITNGTWSVSAMGVTVLSGNISNDELSTQASGSTQLSSVIAPIRWALTGNALIPVSGSVVGTGGSCTASGFIRGSGSAVSSPIFIIGAVIAAIGLILVVSVAIGTTAKGGTL